LNWSALADRVVQPTSSQCRCLLSRNLSPAGHDPRRRGLTVGEIFKSKRDGAHKFRPDPEVRVPERDALAEFEGKFEREVRIKNG
jgi:hypothetical protein